MSNVYLEKIAAFQLPRAISRYSRSRTIYDDWPGTPLPGPIEQVKEFLRTAKGNSFYKNKAVESKRSYDFHDDYLKSRKAGPYNKTYQDVKDHIAATGKMSDLSKEQRDAYTHIDRQIRYRKRYAKRYHDERVAANLATKGARKTLGAIVGGTAAIGIGGPIAYNKLKDKD